MSRLYFTCMLGWALHCLPCPLHGQTPLFGDADTTLTLQAGLQYQRGKLHQRLWGSHYRNEWITPIRVKAVLLDTLGGGLVPYGAGGGRQSKTLRLHDSANREYVLRSIDKSFGGALPPIFRNTFVESLINDQASIAHPYAAITIPRLAAAAKIYHTQPQIVYIPAQPRLDSFNGAFGNTLYLFEQRPDENWETAPNFGYAPKIIGTEKLQEHLLENSRHRVDQLAFVRARLFDIFIGDWGRHEDQWRWGRFEQDGQYIYQPIPRDRDQTYTRFDGLLLQSIMSIAGLKHLQTFDSDVQNIATFNFPARHLDRQMANELTLKDWMNIAADLRNTVTDAVIDAAVSQLPAEVYAVSGPKIAAILKARRNKLPDLASAYYYFLAREVDVTGTKGKDHFEVEWQQGQQIKVQVYHVDSEGTRAAVPYYSRLFNSKETKEIRLYGIDGQDEFVVSGITAAGTKVRIIGGPGQDHIKDCSLGNKKRLLVYDDDQNIIEAGPSTGLRLSNDTAVHQYQYNSFHYSHSSFKPLLFYSRDDRLYAGIGYKTRQYKWRRQPFAHEHGVYARYSLVQNAISLAYEGTINQFWKQWNLHLQAGYDPVRWMNFFGIGNETKREWGNRSYHRVRTSETAGGIGVSRNFGKYFLVDAGLLFQTVSILNDEERFATQYFKDDPDFLQRKYYVGGKLGFAWGWINDGVVPTKGAVLKGNISHTLNAARANGAVTHYNSSLQVYVPLHQRLVLASRWGAASLSGNPELYQLNSIGGSQMLRGFIRNRFWGQKAVYSSNELQWIFDLKSYLFNGKAGLIGLYDIGRVWQPGERSDKWHPGYGGGFFVAPFNVGMVSFTYGLSEDGGRLHFRLSKPI